MYRKTLFESTKKESDAAYEGINMCATHIFTDIINVLFFPCYFSFLMNCKFRLYGYLNCDYFSEMTCYQLSGLLSFVTLFFCLIDFFQSYLWLNQTTSIYDWSFAKIFNTHIDNTANGISDKMTKKNLGSMSMRWRFMLNE